MIQSSFAQERSFKQTIERQKLYKQKEESMIVFIACHPEADDPSFRKQCLDLILLNSDLSKEQATAIFRDEEKGRTKFMKITQVHQDQISEVYKLILREYFPERIKWSDVDVGIVLNGCKDRKLLPDDFFVDQFSKIFNYTMQMPEDRNLCTTISGGFERYLQRHPNHTSLLADAISEFLSVKGQQAIFSIQLPK